MSIMHILRGNVSQITFDYIGDYEKEIFQLSKIKLIFIFVLVIFFIYKDIYFRYF